MSRVGNITAVNLAIVVTPPAQTSTNTYATVTGSTIDTLTVGAASIAYRIQVATNTLKVKIRGSIDGTNYTDLQTFTLDTQTQDGATENVVTAGASNGLERHVGSLASYRYYDVQVKANVGGSQGTATVTGYARGGLAGSTISATAVSISGAVPAGTNNIGDVDVATIAAGDNNIGNVDVASIAAGTNNVGDVDIASQPTQTVAPAAYTTTNAYAYVTGTAIDTGGATGGPRMVAYRVTVATNTVDIKMQGSFDNATWDDLTVLDEAGADQAQAAMVVAAAGTEHFRVSGVGKTAKDAANGCYRYLRLVAQSDVADTAGDITVKGFAR